MTPALKGGAEGSIIFRRLLSGPIVTVTLADGGGRSIQTEKNVERNTSAATKVGMTVSGPSRFDGLGRVVERGQPVFRAEPDVAFVNVEMKNATWCSYD